MYLHRSARSPKAVGSRNKVRLGTRFGCAESKAKKRVQLESSARRMLSSASCSNLNSHAATSALSSAVRTVFAIAKRGRISECALNYSAQVFCTNSLKNTRCAFLCSEKQFVRLHFNLPVLLLAELLIRLNRNSAFCTIRAYTCGNNQSALYSENKRQSCCNSIARQSCTTLTSKIIVAELILLIRRLSASYDELAR